MKVNYTMNRSIPQTVPAHDSLPLRPFGWLDVLIIIFLSFFGILTFPTFTSDQMSTVVVYRDNVVAYRFPLNENGQATLSGAHGKLMIDITAGTVSVNHSDCPNHICQRSGRIHSVNSQIICAPNHLIITIAGSKEVPVDAILR